MTFPPLGGARGGNPGGDCPPGRGRRHRNLCQCAHWRTVNGRLPRHGGRALPHLFWLPRYARRGVFRRAGRRTTPPNGQGGGRARGGHTWPTNIKSGLMPARQGTAQGPAAQRGGAKPRAALPPPLQIRAERGGGSAPHLFFVPSCHRRAYLENAAFPHMEQKKTPAGALPWRPYFAFFRIEV